MTTNIASLATHAARYIADDLNSPDGVPFKDLTGFISTIVSAIGLSKSERNKIGFTHIPSGDATIAMNGMRVEAYVSIWYRHNTSKIELVIPASNSGDEPMVYLSWSSGLRPSSEPTLPPQNERRQRMPVELESGISAADEFVGRIRWASSLI